MARNLMSLTVALAVTDSAEPGFVCLQCPAAAAVLRQPAHPPARAGLSDGGADQFKPVIIVRVSLSAGDDPFSSDCRSPRLLSS
jgi:hypothetical protein